MKRLAMILLAVSAITFSASAQDKKEIKGHHGKKHHGRDMMAKQLNFSEDQKKQAKANREDFRKKMQELNKLENITVKEQRERKAALLKEQKAKMDNLLTAEQKTKLAQLKAEKKQKHAAHMAKRMDKMKSELGLSEAQVAQLKSQREATGAKMKAIKENEGLSREQKKEQMMALKSESKAAHQKIFTADQLKKLEEMKKNRPDKNKMK